MSTNLTDFSEISAMLPIHSDKGAKQTVSAKAFHEALGFHKANWAAWYKSNIVKNQFAIEGEDYASLIVGMNANKTPNMDFEITLDFAKRLAMMSKTENGEIARLYFIACEQKSLSVVAMSDDEIMAKGYMLSIARNEQLSLENSQLKEQRKIDAPKLENYDELINADGLISMDGAGKSIGISGIRLKKLLVEDGFFTLKDKLPKQKFINDRYFEVIPVLTEYNGRMYPQPFVTGKGLDLVCSWFKTRNHVHLNNRKK